MQKTQMNEKSLLINSMEKLINHVKKSQANQQEIFYSLSRTDFKKILFNMEDANLMLRKTSLNLMAELVSQNSLLKTKFCKTMDINLMSGKVILNSSYLQKRLSAAKLAPVLKLLKMQFDSKQSECLIWFMNFNNKTVDPKIQYIYKRSGIIDMQIDIDPQECLVGFFITENDLNVQPSFQSLSVKTTNASSSVDSQKQSQLKNLIQQNPRKLITVIGPKANLTLSDSQPKYQRNGKNTSIENQRPRKYINNFLHQRKHNSFKGNQSQKHTIANGQSIYITKQPNESSNQIHRSTMPKSSQTPFIPSLSFDGGNDSVGYRTERLGQNSFTATNNCSKQMDFQKVKYQGIKLTTSGGINRTSYGGMIQRVNTDRDQVDSQSSKEQNFKPQTRRQQQYLASYNNCNAQNIQNLSTPQAQQSISSKRQSLQGGYNFKYIKPVTTVHQINQQGAKFINFFHKKVEEQPPLIEKKTIDVFQYIKNR